MMNDPQPTVSVQVGATINSGKFESLRVTVDLNHRPVETSEEQAIKKAYQTALDNLVACVLSTAETQAAWIERQGKFAGLDDDEIESRLRTWLPLYVWAQKFNPDARIVIQPYQPVIEPEPKTMPRPLPPSPIPPDDDDEWDDHDEDWGDEGYQGDDEN